MSLISSNNKDAANLVATGINIDESRVNRKSLTKSKRNWQLFDENAPIVGNPNKLTSVDYARTLASIARVSTMLLKK